jgi:RNA polymerase sigma-70 factor (ECF subfamily)
MQPHRTDRGDDPWDWRWVRRFCLRETQRILGRSADAEDAAQEAVIRAWRRRDTCRNPQNPSSWLTAIARREALRAAGQRIDQPLSAASADRWAISEDPSGENMDLRRALVAMSGSDRALIAARYWEDLAVAEVARRLGMPEGTAKVRLHRLRAQLRQTLSES